MDPYLQKYLDGDLSEREAADFMRMLDDDPELEAELRAFERALTTAAGNLEREPTGGFTERVMTRIREQWATPTPGIFARLFGRWAPRLAWAAAFAAVFMVGYIAARNTGRRDGGISTVTSAENVAEPLRVAKLVYVPAGSNVTRVAVAGTFNGWNPEATSMTREGDVWVVQLLLPPQTYEYMFVVDGQRWVTDPLATETRDDGFGRENAVLDLHI